MAIYLKYGEVTGCGHGEKMFTAANIGMPRGSTQQASEFGQHAVNKSWLPPSGIIAKQSALALFDDEHTGFKKHGLVNDTQEPWQFGTDKQDILVGGEIMARPWFDDKSGDLEINAAAQFGSTMAGDKLEARRGPFDKMPHLDPANRWRDLPTEADVTPLMMQQPSAIADKYHMAS